MLAEVIYERHCCVMRGKFESAAEMMRVVRKVAFVGAVLALAAPALAFEEQGAQSVGGAKQSLDGTVVGSPKSGSTGPSVELPGLGNLGVIPKLDFGLELLYGDRRNGVTEVEPDGATADDSLRVRGTIRHRF